MRKISLLFAMLLLAVPALACAVPTETTETPLPVAVDEQAPGETAATPQQQNSAATKVNALDQSELWIEMDAAAPFHYDLDGDGLDEIVAITVNEDAYTTQVSITQGATGSVYTDQIDCALSFLSCRIGNATIGDGYIELYLTGDAASDDYESFIYRMMGAGIERCEMTNGRIMKAFGNGFLQFDVPVNVLGTYEGTCSYVLDEQMQLTLATDYTVMPYEGAPYHILTLQKDGLVALRTSPGEAELAELAAGTELFLTSTDLKSYVLLQTESGAAYRVAIAEDTEAGWGWLVEGVPESEWFGEVPYAG